MVYLIISDGIQFPIQQQQRSTTAINTEILLPTGGSFPGSVFSVESKTHASRPRASPLCRRYDVQVGFSLIAAINNPAELLSLLSPTRG
jgi:hypothetical protein